MLIFNKSSSLASKVISGSFWVVVSRLARRSVGLISAVILARILSPTDYGLVAVGLLCVSLFRIFTEVGIKPNLIQERDHNAALLSTAWTLEVTRGLVICVAIFFMAPIGADFFHQPAATPIIRAMSVIPLLSSIANIKIICFQKELEFHKQFIYEISGAVVGIITAVTSALILRNAWALVLGQVAAELTLTILSYIYFPELPRITFARHSLRKLYTFGKWVFLGGIVSYFAMEGDKYFVGRLFGVELLGMYKMASMLTCIITDEFGKSITKVLFPAYSKIRGDLYKLRSVFLKSYETLLSILAPSCLGLFIIADDFVPVILGNKWLGMIPLLKLLALVAFVRTFFISGAGLFWALNKPKYNTVCEIIRAVVLLIFLLILPSIIGVSGVIISLLIANVAVFILYLILWDHVLDIRTNALLKIYLPLILSLSVMLAIVSILKMVLQEGLIRLILSVCTGSIVYCSVLFSIYRFFNIGPAYIFEYFILRRKTIPKSSE
jgi:O-antigen/teichoic acid export membrane protein